MSHDSSSEIDELTMQVNGWKECAKNLAGCLHDCTDAMEKYKAMCEKYDDEDSDEDEAAEDADEADGKMYSKGSEPKDDEEYSSEGINILMAPMHKAKKKPSKAMPKDSEDDMDMDEAMALLMKE
tara:strand:+ start:1046 stop:1420 length:375 start_codon:yes stop_codon:yes gene_type:complete